MGKKITFYLLPIIFSFIISFPLLLPYFHSGYFPTHDGEWAVVRLSDMYREVRDFQFPARYSGNLNFGYGYPLFNFTYPFPYYLGTGIHLLKFGFADSIKILFMLSIFFSSYGMFLASYSLWKNKRAGAISAFLYLAFPYRSVDLFVRGSVGESIAFALFPFIYFFLVKQIENNRSVNNALIAGFLFAVLITTHNIMAVFFICMLLPFITVNIYKNKSLVFSFALFFIFALSISAFFWIPALFEKHFILLSRTPIADRNLYFVSLSQLLFSPWGYGTPTESQPFTYQIGWIQIIFFLVLASSLSLGKKFSAKHLQEIGYTRVFLTTIIIFFFMMFSFSSIIWRLPFLSEINYPWILLGPIGFLISLSSGFLITKSHSFNIFFVILASLALLIQIPNSHPSGFINKGDGYYFTNDATTTSSDELMPLWVKDKPIARYSNKVEFLKGEGAINNLFFNSKYLTFTAHVQKESIIQLNTIYYPGWVISIDGKNQTPIYNNDKGVMQIKIAGGNHKVVSRFTETPIRLMSDLISIAGIISFVLFLIIVNKKAFLSRLY